MIPVRTAGGASTLADYNFTFTNTTPYGLTITKAPLLVTALNDTETYDDTTFPGDKNGVTYTTFVNGDTVASLGGTLTYSGTSQTAINAGTGYTIIPSGYTSPNYTISYANGTLTINKAPLTVTADNQMKTFGDPDPTLTYTPTGTLYGTDTYSSVISGVSLSTTTGAAATGGTHPIVASGGTASNYVITDVNGVSHGQQGRPDDPGQRREQDL